MNAQHSEAWRSSGQAILAVSPQIRGQDRPQNVLHDLNHRRCRGKISETGILYEDKWIVFAGFERWPNSNLGGGLGVTDWLPPKEVDRVWSTLKMIPWGWQAIGWVIPLKVSYMHLLKAQNAFKKHT